MRRSLENVNIREREKDGRNYFFLFVESHFLLQVEHIMFLYLGFFNLSLFDFNLSMMKYRDREEYIFYDDLILREKW